MEDIGIVIGVIGIVLSLILWAMKPEFIVKLFRTQKITNFIKSQNLSNDFTIAVVDDELDSYPIPYIGVFQGSCRV
jgi:hypothetical protein